MLMQEPTAHKLQKKYIRRARKRRRPAGRPIADSPPPPPPPMAGGRNREWMRKQMAMAMATARKESPRWTRRVRALSAAMRRPGRNGLSRADRLRLLYESIVFRLLWVLETLIVLATLCFFFLRFGFRL